ncbi:glycosyltransferase family 39 protein [Streptomyces meridianus]|uniref:Glycosyltransferase family 39 protein n=1 Tax=Streptomyces meridianus TaxID=2938945 RepID=A0ABT0WZN0_9ACTN|nr:glycosyltransferase family 39 protein [Streptomyces meridianus]MCM2575769.1 glycosyltransferase family 39 protein [Streptomyces meridianus]
MVTTQLQLPQRRGTPLSGPASAITVLLPALTAVALGLWGLGSRGLSGDETATWAAARRSPGELWQLASQTDAVHGPYYLLMQGLLALRPDELVLRLPSVAAMGLAAALVAAIGTRLAAPMVGLAAGMLFAVVPAVSRYAQQAHEYALVTACATAATYFLIRGCEEDEDRWWCGYAAVVAVAGLLHPSALLLLFAHAATLLLVRAVACLWLRWVMAAAFACLVAAPVMWTARGQAGPSDWAAPGWPAFTELVRAFAGPSGWVALPTVVFAIGALLTRRRSRDEGPIPGLTVPVLALPLLVLPPALLFAVSQLHPVYAERYVLFALPGFCLLVAAGIERMADAVTPWAVAMPLTAALLVAFTFGGQFGTHLYLRSPESRPDDQRAVARLVQRSAEPRDAILFLGGDRRKAAVAYPDAFAGLDDVALDRSPARSGTLYGTELAPERLHAAMADVRRVWVLEGAGTERATGRRPAGERAKEALLADFHSEREERTRGARLNLFVRN